MSHMVYLDHNATTPVRPEAAEAATAALSLVGNASSVHRFGRATRGVIEEAREAVAALVGAAPDAVLFTSGGTEANHLALRGCGRERIVAGATEHASVLKARDGIEILPVDGNGVVEPKALEAALAASDAPAVVSVQLANNETGVLQPVAEVAEIARRHGALVHCDAVQALGKMPVDLAVLGAHMVSVSGHKAGGLPGVGALVLAGGATLTARGGGGGQERGLRPGTENVPGIAAFGAAARVLREEQDEVARITALRDRLETAIETAAPEVRVLGKDAARLPNTSCLLVPGHPGAAQVMALDLAGVMVSAGSACSSGKVAPSHVLGAMGLNDDDAASAIRVSLGWTSHEADVDRFVEAWTALRARRLAA